MSFNENNLQKLRFDSFGSDKTKKKDWKDSVFCADEEAATSFKELNDKTFSVLHFNVRSLNQNFESYKELLTTIKFEFKVTCLTETWCTDDPRNDTLFNVESYTSISQVMRHGRRGGICVFIHNSLTLKVSSDLGTNSNDISHLP